MCIEDGMSFYSDNLHVKCFIELLEQNKIQNKNIFKIHVVLFFCMKAFNRSINPHTL